MTREELIERVIQSTRGPVPGTRGDEWKPLPSVKKRRAEQRTHLTRLKRAKRGIVDEVFDDTYKPDLRSKPEKQVKRLLYLTKIHGIKVQSPNKYREFLKDRLKAYR